MNKDSPVTTTSENTQRDAGEDFGVVVLRSNDSEMHDLATELHLMVKSLWLFVERDLSEESVLVHVLFASEQAKRIFLILPDALGKFIVPLIHDFPPIDSIYIFAQNMIKPPEWMAEWKKIQGVFVDISSICYELKRSIQRCQQESMLISIVPPSTKIDLNKLDSTFMYTLLLKEILFNMKYDEQAKAEFVNYCRLKIAEIETTSHAIDEFESDYSLHSPIWWYTKDTFIYPMLNKALRTQDCETCIKMGFFVRELHEQLKRVHSMTSQTNKFFVYRGQGVSNAALEKLKKSEGGLFSFNFFVSTSYDRLVAFAYADSIQSNPDLLGVLFEMEIDPTIASTPFASLVNIGYYSNEQEILFSMHTVFRIGQLQQTDSGLWEIKLILTSDGDEELKCLTEFVREETEHPLVHVRLGRLMVKMGEYDKAERIFQTILETTAIYNRSVIADFCHQLGHIIMQRGDLKTALSYIEKGFEIQKKILPSNHTNMAVPYQNMGMLQYLMGDYRTSQSYYERSLEIQEKKLPPDDFDLARIYNCMGILHQSMGNYSSALVYYDKVHQIQRKILPPNHPDLAGAHINIGTLHLLMGKHQTALFHFQEALSIQQDTLSCNHPDLATTYHSIAGIHQTMENYSEAVSSYKKALEIQEKLLPRFHHERAKTYHNMARLYTLSGDSYNAFLYLQKTLEIYQTDVFQQHSNLGTTYNSIGGLHQSIGDYRTALSCYEKALAIHQTSLPSTATELAATYSNIASAHNLLGNYSTALPYYENALSIQEKILSPNHPDLAVVYNSIGRLYQSMGNCSVALSYFEKAFQIQQSIRPDTNSELASICNNIGMVQVSMKQYSTAIVHFEKSLRILEHTFSVSHSSIASIYVNLGAVYQLMNDISTARSYFQRALKIQRETLRPNHPTFAATYNSLGYLHDAMGDYSNALAYYEKAHEILRVVVSSNHPDLAIVRNNIAATRGAMLTSPAALASFQEKLATRLERSLGHIRDISITLTATDAKPIVIQSGLPFEATSTIELRQNQEMSTTESRHNQESTMKNNFHVHLSKCCRTSGSITLVLGIVFVVLVILLVVPITIISIGVKYKHQCPINSNIPQFVIVCGALGLVNNIFLLFKKCIEKDDPKSNSKCCLCVLIPLQLFLFIWVLLGSVWIFSVKSNVQYSDPTDPTTYCHKTLYLFTFTILIIGYVLLSLSFILNFVCNLLTEQTDEGETVSHRKPLGHVRHIEAGKIAVCVPFCCFCRFHGIKSWRFL